MLFTLFYNHSIPEHNKAYIALQILMMYYTAGVFDNDSLTDCEIT